ncbi:MAG TPA: PTS glucose transporter subunit IIA [Firmicutes bacterium]|jgi:PTS system glucose-specific IIA component|nr:PTS glucose transporter subunit IIA [Bacillota bacterium]
MLGLLFNRKKPVEVKAPVYGETVDLVQLPDPVFAEKMVGDGLAFQPCQGVLYAPVDGEVVQVFPTMHAIGLRTAEGLELLIHIGLDTVEMKGEGFKTYITQHQQVKVGDKMIEFDLDLITAHGKSTLTPLIITNMTAVKKLKLFYGKVTPQTTVMEVRI